MMIQEFHDLIQKNTESGARERFEAICTELYQTIYGNRAHNIRPSQGDGGIDVMVGDFSEPIEVIQCKFFHDKLGDSQKQQIRESFERAWENQDFEMVSWTLSIPLDLSDKEMKWWSGWKDRAETQTGVEIELCDGSNLLTLLKRHGLYESVFGTDPTSRADHYGQVLTKDRVEQAACACTARDIVEYYKVDTRFETMLRVIGGDKDVPHQEAEQAVFRAISENRPVILTGNGGMGKTSLMLRCAVRWARAENVAVWLNLGNHHGLTERDAKKFWNSLNHLTTGPDRVLVCIDDPYDGREALNQLRRTAPSPCKVRLLMAERSNRLRILAEQNKSKLTGLFDDAQVVALEGLYADRSFRLRGYHTIACKETKERRKQILDNCLFRLEKMGVIPREKHWSLLGYILKTYGKPHVSLVELIYRILFEAQSFAQKPEEIMLDWDEWGRMLRDSLEVDEASNWLYAPIAVCGIFDLPMPVSFYCRIFELRQRKLVHVMRDWYLDTSTEPVRYLEDQEVLRAKHSLIAELFFRFHQGRPGISDAMAEVAEAANELEAENILRQIVTSKWELQKGVREAVEGIDYWSMLMAFLDREETNVFRLSDEARATALLGLLWCLPRKDRAGRTDTLLRLLGKKVPPMSDSLTLAKLYTEWGKLLTDRNQPREAEQVLKAVVEAQENNIHSRTELGRLLMKQPGREGEAERYLKEAIQIESTQIQPRTELGRLLMKQPGREGEAEDYLNEIIKLDSQNLHARIELAALCIHQGRLAEAEQLYRTVWKLDPGNHYARSGLKKLGIDI